MEKSGMIKECPSLKAIWILEVMGQKGGYVGINEICEETGLSQSTVHRILTEMIQTGYVEKNEQYRKYRVGIKAAVLASYFMQSNNVVAFARDEMIRLNRETTETVHLLALSGDSVIYLNKINTSHTIGLMSYIGKTNPIHCTSGGKCMMAYMDQHVIDDYLATSHRERFSEHTLVTEDELRSEFEKIRQQGYAVDHGEHHENINCVSAPIFDQLGKPVASISISAPSYRFQIEKAISLAPEVISSCRAVSARLGG